MREDMAKVIVERPRWGSRLPSRKKRYRKATERVPMEDRPRCEPLLGRWCGRQRQLNEHLGPLRRFLWSQVGRPWNKVHHDLCEFVSFDNAVQKHILEHVFDYVIEHVEIVDGKPVSTQGWRRGRALQEREMYICPRTGLLKAAPGERPAAASQRIGQGQPRQYQVREGVWWELKLRPCPADPDEAWDPWLEQQMTRENEPTRRGAYGENLIAISCRPLSASEARQLFREHRSPKSRSHHRRSPCP